jgi:WD40 repeat protein
MGQSGEKGQLRPPSLAPARGARRGEGFFVAGGPVAPDRDCYIARSADETLFELLRAGDYCHVMAPRFSGKSSLAASAATRWRASGGLAAIVDLSQLGGRDGSSDTGRWYYSLAYRILRDLRLKIDLQSWWQERMPLPPAQRLGEFFWEIVIGATRAPVVVFFDEIDCIEQSDYAVELFGIVRACHDARASEPEYRRLSFVLLGAALPSGKAERSGLGAVETGPRLELPDFRFEEARPLAEGLGLPEGDAERALYRVFYWTGGHPYLTQKLCQAIARNAARINSDEAVDRLVAARFFARRGVTTETSLSQVLDRIDRAGKRARPALRLYRRIRRGRRPRYDPAHPEQELLRVCGLVSVTGDRRLVVRNRIYAEVFSHRWAREALPPEWGRLGRAAALAVLVLGGLWTYLEVLPRPYEETLRVASEELDEAIEAWSSLRRIPGFGSRADRLLARALVRASRQAETWVEVDSMDARLRGLSGYEARADALLVEYWERRAAAAEAAERRDEALLYRLRAHAAGPTADAGLAAQLAGSDFQRLLTVIRPAGVVEALGATPDGGHIVTVSAGNLVERWESATGTPAPGHRLELVAQEFISVRRRLSLDTGGRVASPVVELRLDHPRPEDLRLALVSPAGRTVELPLDGAEERGEALVLDESSVPGLRALRGEQALGTWLLEIEDRGGGEAGFLLGWSLVVSPAPGHRGEERPENPVLLPTPLRSSAVQVALSPRGSIVAAVPRNAESRGRLHAWDTASSRVLASIDVSAAERWLGFADERTLLLLEAGPTGEQLRALDPVTGEERFRQFAPDGFAAGPATSPDGRHLAMSEAVSKLAWIRETGTGREVFRMPSAGEATAIAVSPGGLTLALADRGGVVRVWHATDGTLSAELPQAAPVVALAFDPSGRWLVSVDRYGRMRVWDLLSPEGPPVLTRSVADPQQFAFDATGRRFLLLAPADNYEAWQLPDGEPYGPVLRHGGTRVMMHGSADSLAGTMRMLLEDNRLVGGRGTRSVRVWQVTRDAAPTEVPRIPELAVLARSGLRAATGTSDGRVIVRMRDPDSLALQLSSITRGGVRHGGGVTAMAFSPDASRLVSVGEDGSVMLWNASDGQLVGPVFQHGSGRVEAVKLGSDGRLLLTAGELGARTWDGETGLPGPMLGPGRAVSAVALDAAGLRAYTGTPAGEIESWDISSGERLWFASMDAPIARIALSGNGSRVAAAGGNGVVQAWGLGTAARPLSLALAAPVTGLQFSPDGSALLAQTAGWLHRLGVVEGRLRVLASRVLPAASAPGAWRSATEDAMRVVLVGGAHGETLAILDFERAPLPPDDWAPDIEAWQQRLKLYFADDGELHHGLTGAIEIM